MSEERCPSCGYTKEDAQFHMDHRFCKNAGNAPWEKKAESVGEPPRAEPPKSDAELAGELAGYVLRKAEDHLGLRGCEIDMDQETYHMEEMLAELRREFHLPPADELPISQENRQFLKDTILPAMRRKAGSRPSAPAPTREGLCEDCGKEYPTPWFAGNDLWHLAVECSANPKNFLCMHCFVKRADKVIRCTGWEIVPENKVSAPAPNGEPPTCDACGNRMRRGHKWQCHDCDTFIPEPSPVDLQQEARKWLGATYPHLTHLENFNPDYLPKVLAAFATHLREGR